jgi:hypothetical protein
MEITDPFNIDHQLTTDASPRSVEESLGLLLAANAEIAKRKLLYPTRQVELEAAMMSRPIDFRQTYAYLGLMLGLFPPASFFLLFLISKGMLAKDELWILALLIWVNAITAVVGYFSGKVVGSALSNIGKRSFSFFALVTPLIGLLWGGLSGAAGGVFIFVIGAFFGAFIGGIVGAAALPVFLLIHNLLKCGDMIELKHFLPISAAVTFSICAFILSFLR